MKESRLFYNTIYKVNIEFQNLSAMRLETVRRRAYTLPGGDPRIKSDMASRATYKFPFRYIE